MVHFSKRFVPRNRNESYDVIRGCFWDGHISKFFVGCFVVTFFRLAMAAMVLLPSAEAFEVHVAASLGQCGH